MSYNTALIVDDSKLARIALKKKLEQRGMQIVMAEDAKQALGVLEETPIDIVFMDHLMPEMDGFEATRQIKANQATTHLPVIMCSGKEKQGYLEEARAIGASNVLPKPAESEAIDAVFAELEQRAPAPVAEIVATPAEAPIAAAAAKLDEARVETMLQPLSEQLKALAIQLDEQGEEIEQRFAASVDSLRAIESQQQNQPEVDVPALQAQLLAEVDQRMASLEIPNGGAIQSELDSQWESKLTAAISAAVTGIENKIEAANEGAQTAVPAMDQWVDEVEQRLGRSVEASLVQLVEDKGEQLESMLLRLLEERQVQTEPDAPTVERDDEQFRQSLKDELMAEWIERAGEFRSAADNQDFEVSLELPARVKVLPWITAFSSLLAVAAIALHWM